MFAMPSPIAKISDPVSQKVVCTSRTAIPPTATATMNIPAVITVRELNLATRIALVGAPTMKPIANGTIRNPVSSGE